MKVMSLQSGSGGNCYYIESDGVRLLIDAGISGKSAESRLADRGIDIRDVDALVISHEHSDHVACAGVIQRKYDIPMYITKKTLAAANQYYSLGHLHNLHHFKAGSTLTFGHVSVETIPTPHDAVDGVVFVVDDGDRRLGVMTDLGHCFDTLQDALGTIDGVMLESNYDPEMLEVGPYPPALKRRIQSPQGHISNVESAELIQKALESSGRLQWACLAHLSGSNNSPELALKTHRQIAGNDIELFVDNRNSATDLIEV